MTTDLATTLPDGFQDLERFVADWARPTRQERYDRRLTAGFDELLAFYDAIAPLAEAAIAHLDAADLATLDGPDLRLLQLLYSMILVSYAVNVFDQPKIPDSGSAFFDCVVEPTI